MNELFTLREICERGGVTRRMVQRYEQKGLVKPVAVNKYGHLLYDEQGLFQIKRIRLYHQFGFQLDEIKLYIESDSGMWNDKQRETFYKIFVPLMLGLIVLFAIIYLIKCMKTKIVGMVVSNILTIVAYELLKWDFADRRVVPGSFDKGIAFVVMYIAFALMIAGIVLSIIEKKKQSVDNNIG